MSACGRINYIKHIINLQSTLMLKNQGSNYDSLSDSESSIDDSLKLFKSLKLGEDAYSDIRKTLILVDFNGTLVYRDSNNARSKDVIRPCQKPDFVIRYGRFWNRPFACKFVSHLLNDPRCVIAIYTSMKRLNMSEVVQSFDRYHESKEFEPFDVFGTVIDTYKSLETGCIDIFDQPYNQTDFSGKNRWDTMRDLSRIWRSDQIQRLDDRYDETNTLLIEAEPRKSRNWQKNTICPREFKASDVGKSDDTLECVLNYLNYTVFPKMQEKKRGGTDVREILKSSPFGQI